METSASSGPRLLPSSRPERLAACVVATAIGGAIAWLDTRPHWDDAGVTAGAVAIVAAIGAILGLPTGLAAGLVITPMIALEVSSGAGVLLAAPAALLGAFAGSLARRCGRPAP